MMWFFFLVAFGQVQSADLVADYETFAAHLEEVEQALEVAHVQAVATARLQNTFADPKKRVSWRSCRNPAHQDLVARLRVFGASHRDAVQSARARYFGLERILDSPILKGGEDQTYLKKAEEVGARIESQVGVSLEFMGWHTTYVEKPWWNCKSPLRPLKGEVNPRFPLDPPSMPMAIAVVEGGRLCPQNVVGMGEVLLVNTLEMCWTSSSSCDCELKPVLPGAVLGPTKVSE